MRRSAYPDEALKPVQIGVSARSERSLNDFEQHSRQQRNQLIADDYGTNLPFLETHEQRLVAKRDLLHSIKESNLESHKLKVAQQACDRLTESSMDRPERNAMFAKETVANQEQLRFIKEKKLRQREALEARFAKVHAGNTRKDAPFTSLDDLDKRQQKVAQA